MSGLKVFALGILVSGTLASSTRGGSILDGPYSSSPGAGPAFTSPTSLVYGPGYALENLAQGDPSVSGAPAPAYPSQGGFNGGGVVQGGALVLGVNQPSGAANPTGLAWSSNPPAASSSPSPAPSNASADAFINFGTAPYAEANTLTTGNPESFLSSPVFSHLYPNGPSSQDVANFEAQVLNTIQSTYNNAGLAIHLTTSPGDPAAHMMSVVSGASNPQNPDAIGITDVGNNGFSFIDKFGAAQTPSQLATAIGHNLSHELMHAFGLANHPEQSGPYVDAATTTFANLSDPSTGFSPAAAALLSTLNFQATGRSINATGAQKIDGDQVLVTNASPVPEPSTVGTWALALVSVAIRIRRRRASA